MTDSSKRPDAEKLHGSEKLGVTGYADHDGVRFVFELVHHPDFEDSVETIDLLPSVEFVFGEHSDKDIHESVVFDFTDEEPSAIVYLDEDDPYYVHKVFRFLHLALNKEMAAESHEAVSEVEELDEPDEVYYAALLDAFAIFGDRLTVDATAAKKFTHVAALATPALWTVEFKSALAKLAGISSKDLYDKAMASSSSLARLIIENIGDVKFFVDNGAVFGGDDYEPLSLEEILLGYAVGGQEAAVQELPLASTDVESVLQDEFPGNFDAKVVDWNDEKLKIWEQNIEKQVKMIRSYIEHDKHKMITEILAKAAVEIFMAEELGVAGYEEAIGDVYGLSVSEKGRQIVNAIKMRYFREGDKQIFARLARSKDPLKDLEALLDKSWQLQEAGAAREV